MSLSRRRFLEVGTVVAAGASVPLHGLAATTAANALGNSGETLHQMSPERLQQFVGTDFAVDAGLGRPLHMELASIESFAEPKVQDNASGHSFVMNFRLMKGSAVRQGTYEFQHKELGKASLLIVPSNTRPTLYAAVINHRRPLF